MNRTDINLQNHSLQFTSGMVGPTRLNKSKLNTDTGVLEANRCEFI